MATNVLLIIGASSAIGCEIILQTSDANTVVLAHYNTGKDKLLQLASQVKSQIIPIQADLSADSGCDTLLESVAASGHIPNQIVFLAAPHVKLVRFKELTLEDFKANMDIQLYSTLQILQLFLPAMSKAKKGKIVFVLSSYTMGMPPGSMAHYVTTKYALLGLMKSLASEFASKQICINAVSPSMVTTDFLSELPEKIIEFTAQQHPLKRNALPSDVAPLVRFLLSDESSYITGTNIPVAGGSQA